MSNAMEERVSNHKDGRGRPLEQRPTGPGTALCNFLIERLPELDLTNDEIARILGYARPNVVSMWKTGRTKFTWDNLFGAATLFQISPEYLLAMILDQYVSSNDGVDRFPELIDMVDRMVTPEEFEVVKAMREARKFNSVPATPKQIAAVKDLFEAPPTTLEGHYKPLESVKHIKEGDRRRFARRGFKRDLTVDEAEELRLRREQIRLEQAAERARRRGDVAPAEAEADAEDEAVPAEKTVRKRPARKPSADKA